MSEAVIEVRGLINRFGEQVVHDGLDLDVHEGEILGIVGGSGSGKSVLLRTLLGLRAPQGGSIRIHGQDITRMSEKEQDFLHRKTGVLFQSGALYSGLTVAENIMLPMQEYLKLPEEVQRELALLKLHLTGLPAAAGEKFPAELSGGMVKRAGLARALALDPAFLFLDEPTAGLDPIAASDFDALILSLRAALGLTVLMITHDLDSLFTLCDRVAVLVDKKIIVGTLDEITRNPHPWLQKYFTGPRARAAMESTERHNQQEPHGTPR